MYVSAENSTVKENKIKLYVLLFYLVISKHNNILERETIYGKEKQQHQMRMKEEKNVEKMMARPCTPHTDIILRTCSKYLQM